MLAYTNRTLVQINPRGSSAVRERFAENPEFRRLLAGDADLSLPRIALEIARDSYPSLDVEVYLARIEELAARARARCVEGSRAKVLLGQINWILFVEEGFQGNAVEYYDPRNSYLNEVLDRKTGIPISLSVLYAAVARSIGLDLAGVNLPAHFLLRVEGSDPPLFVDPFREGMTLDEEGCRRQVAAAVGHPVPLVSQQFEPTSVVATVARMLRNLKAIYVQEDDFASALPVVRRLSAIDPKNYDELRDWGLLAYQAGRVGESVSPLARYSEARPRAADTPAVLELLRTARREVARSN